MTIYDILAKLRETHPPATYVPSNRIDQPDNQCLVDMRDGYRQALDDVERELELLVRHVR